MIISAGLQQGLQQVDLSIWDLRHQSRVGIQGVPGRYEPIAGFLWVQAVGIAVELLVFDWLRLIGLVNGLVDGEVKQESGVLVECHHGFPGHCEFRELKYGR